MAFLFLAHQGTMLLCFDIIQTLYVSYVPVLDFHKFFKGLDISHKHIGEVSKSIDIWYGYVKQTKILVLHSISAYIEDIASHSSFDNNQVQLS